MIPIHMYIYIVTHYKYLKSNGLMYKNDHIYIYINSYDLVGRAGVRWLTRYHAHSNYCPSRGKNYPVVIDCDRSSLSCTPRKLLPGRVKSPCSRGLKLGFSKAPPTPHPDPREHHARNALHAAARRASSEYQTSGREQTLWRQWNNTIYINSEGGF